MVSTAPAVKFGVDAFADTRFELLDTSSSEEKQAVIRAAYRQVFGNAHVMESERQDSAESQLCNGTLSVREFVRAIAKSDFYKDRFFQSSSPYRFVELNFKHLLGRAPLSQEEVSEHIRRCAEQGYDAEIDSYIDSDEYQMAYGEDTVPYLRGYKSEACTGMNQFTHFFELVRGASSSSKKGNLAGGKPRLNALVINRKPTPVISPAGEGGLFQEPPLSAPARQGVGAGANGKIYRVEVTAIRAKAVNRVSRFRRSNKVYMVPYDQLSATYQRVHREGGVIASITPVN